MSTGYQRSIAMVEIELRRIGKSRYPSSELCEGMIQANLAHGFINQSESLELTQRAYDVVATRRQELHRESISRRMADMNKLYGRAS